MSDLPALIDEGDTAAAQLGQLEAALAWVRTANKAGASDTAEKARLVFAYLKAVGAAVDLGIAAARLECTALRRLGQLGAEDSIRSTKNGAERANIARNFADMDDATFDGIMGGIDRYVTCIGIHRSWQRERYEAGQHDDGLRIGSGHADRPYHDAGPSDLSYLARAAGALLNEYAPKGRPFTVAEVAEDLADAFGRHQWDDSPATRLGYIEAVRQALRSDPFREHPDTGETHLLHDDLPDWITYREDGAGWVRIPVAVADLDQLRAMAELRRKQSSELAAASAHLDAALADLECVAAQRPGLSSLADLSEAFYADQNLEGSAA